MSDKGSSLPSHPSSFILHPSAFILSLASMPTLTIRKTWTVNGTPTNPTSIVLRDPTGAYGIKRDDAGAVIVAAGTAMTQVSTGVFEYTVAAADPSTTYTAWIEIVYGGETFFFEVTAVAGVDVATATFPDGLTTILNQLTSLYVQITLQPKPTYAVEGNHYRWTEYQEMLGRQIEQLTKLISRAQPFEIVTKG
jgi:hypothetical protein